MHQSMIKGATTNRIVIAVILIVLLATGIFIIKQINRDQSSGSSPITQPASNSSQQNTVVPRTNEDVNLEECFKRVSNSDASQEIINEGLQACRDKFR